jgi:hypothetical protein
VVGQHEEQQQQGGAAADDPGEGSQGQADARPGCVSGAGLHGLRRWDRPPTLPAAYKRRAVQLQPQSDKLSSVLISANVPSELMGSVGFAT